MDMENIVKKESEDLGKTKIIKNEIGGMDKKKVIKFIVITYAISYIIQIIASYFLLKVGGMKGKTIFQVGLMICMYAPTVSALLVKADFKSMGWKPKFRGNDKWIFFSILIPSIFLILGCALFFLIFPDLFSLDGSYLIKSFEGVVDQEQIDATLHKAGMGIKMTILITFIQCITEAPLINMFLAVGEEAGWRGFLYPELRKGFSRVNAWLLGGVVWGLFHFPCIIIAGYEYGLNYIGAPVLGPIVFTIFCIAVGIIHEIIYDKTKCIWYPSLFHGAINTASIVLILLNGNQKEKVDKLFILGPAPNGLISMIPMIIITIIMAVNALKKNKQM